MAVNHTVSEVVSLPRSVVDVVLQEMKRYHEAYSRYLDRGEFDDVEFYLAYASEVQKLSQAIDTIESVA